jgi:pimeloyl-ACP methyl ester carboxylesterase
MATTWSARHRWFDGSGARLHALEDGDPSGPLLILLHGFPETSFAWRRQAPVLAASGFHVIALDQRGYAASEKPTAVSAYTLDALGADVLAIADACEAKTLGVVGHDWGGGVAWWLAVNAPSRLAGASILNAPHPAAFQRVLRRSPGQLRRSWYMLLFQLPRIPEYLLSRHRQRAMVDALDASSRTGTFDDELLAVYRKAWAQPGAWTGMINWYRAAVRRPRQPPHPSPISTPILLLWGDQDRFLLPRLAEDSRELCRDVRLIRLPEATHWLHHEEPGTVARHLLEFFGSLRDEGNFSRPTFV